MCWAGLRHPWSINQVLAVTVSREVSGTSRAGHQANGQRQPRPPLTVYTQKLNRHQIQNGEILVLISRC